ncbi:MAG: hypothetical protein M3458_02155 [Acidobacteriota bacterium]|nr:hypothetical protein [Acidobacteriota bacterium]
MKNINKTPILDLTEEVAGVINSLNSFSQMRPALFCEQEAVVSKLLNFEINVTALLDEKRQKQGENSGDD